MALTAEEKAELAQLEQKAKDEAAAAAEQQQRMHLDAMRMRQRLSTKDKVHGRDFAIVETRIGNFAIRKPTDTEIDTLGESPDQRAAQEKFAIQVTTEPTTDEMRKLFLEHPGLVGPLCSAAIELASVKRAEDAKK